MNNYIIAFILLGGLAYAGIKLHKTSKGIELKEVKTYYENKIIFSDSTSLYNTEVVAYGDGWEYSTTTDDMGIFKVEVNPNSRFKIKASDGHLWANTDYYIDGIEEGTTLSEVIR